MSKPATSIFIRIIIGYGILVLAHLILVNVSNIDVLGIFVAIPFLAIYLLSNMGISGLLEQQGACGWGWCSPTLMGYIVLAGFWFLVIGLFSWVLARLFWRDVGRGGDG